MGINPFVSRRSHTNILVNLTSNRRTSMVSRSPFLVVYLSFDKDHVYDVLWSKSV